MNYHFSFGKHEGRTFERVFFNAPGYADWVYDNGIHRQEHNMDELEGEYFRELYRRACHIVGTCSVCGERPLTRMGLTRHHGGYLAQVGFYCHECEYRGGSRTEYHPPSFFVESCTLDKRESKMITAEIKRHIIKSGRLTQAKMEQYFRTDGNFTNAQAAFFEQWKTEVQTT